MVSITPGITAVNEKAAKNPMKKNPTYIIGIEVGRPRSLLGPTSSMPRP